MVPRETSWFCFPEWPEKHQLSEKKKNHSDKFRFESQLRNIITKHIIAYQRKRVLITLSTITVFYFKTDLY